MTHCKSQRARHLRNNSAGVEAELSRGGRRAPRRRGGRPRPALCGAAGREPSAAPPALPVWRLARRAGDAFSERPCLGLGGQGQGRSPFLGPVEGLRVRVFLRRATGLTGCGATNRQRVCCARRLAGGCSLGFDLIGDCHSVPSLSVMRITTWVVARAGGSNQRAGQGRLSSYCPPARLCGTVREPISYPRNAGGLKELGCGAGNERRGPSWISWRGRRANM